MRIIKFDQKLTWKYINFWAKKEETEVPEIFRKYQKYDETRMFPEGRVSSSVFLRFKLKLQKKLHADIRSKPIYF